MCLVFPRDEVVRPDSNREKKNQTQTHRCPFPVLLAAPPPPPATRRGVQDRRRCEQPASKSASRLAPVCACAEGGLQPRLSELQGQREEQTTGGEQSKAAAPRTSYGSGCREGPEKAGQHRLRLFPCPLDIYGAPTVCQCCVTNRAGTTPPCPRGVYSGRKRQTEEYYRLP